MKCINKNCCHWNRETGDCLLFINHEFDKQFCQDIITDKMTVVDDEFFAES